MEAAIKIKCGSELTCKKKWLIKKLSSRFLLDTCTIYKVNHAHVQAATVQSLMGGL
jgi:hypothetical protein